MGSINKFQIRISMRVSVGNHIGILPTQHVCDVEVLSNHELIENYEYAEVYADKDNPRNVKMFYCVHKHVEAESHAEAIRKALPVPFDESSIRIDEEDCAYVSFNSNCLVSLLGIDLIL